MKATQAVLILVVSLWAWTALAQGQAQDPVRGKRMPPPQAYEDCRGRKAGDTVQHTTPEGTVAATCLDSPEGLVARPSRPPGVQGDKGQPRAPLPTAPR